VFNERADHVLARIAAEQGGVFTRRQCSAAKLTPVQVRHRVQSGWWHEPYPGTFVPCCIALDAPVLTRAALLFAGTEAALSHRSAAVAFQLDGARTDSPELTVPVRRNPRAANLVVHRTTRLPPQDVVIVDGLRTTSATRTIIDVAGVTEPARLEVMFESARRRGLVSTTAVARRLADLGGPGRPGAAALNALLRELNGSAAAESVLEVKTAQLLRRAPLPPPVRQHTVTAHRTRYRLDFAWPASYVALETDGRAHHGDVSDFQRDRTRWSNLAAAGWRVVVATWTDVTRRPDDVIGQLAAALGM
jgi:very-short-patch-repair endonuclease